jgi:hypothetical protein
MRATTCAKRATVLGIIKFDNTAILQSIDLAERGDDVRE